MTILLLGTGKSVTTVTPPGAIQLVAHTFIDASGSAGGTTPAINTTSASFLVACVSTFFFDNNTLTDSKGNTWASLPSRGSGNTGQLWYVISPIVGTGHTFTTPGAGFPAMCVAAFSGVTGTFDQETGAATGGATSLATGALLPSVNGCLLIAGMGMRDTPTVPYSINAGFSVIDSAANGAGLAWLAQTTAASANPTWSWGASASGGVTMGVFKP